MKKSVLILLGLFVFSLGLVSAGEFSSDLDHSLGINQNECADGEDNDEDGNIDLDDPNCENVEDNSEDSGCSENYDDKDYPGRDDNCKQWYDYYVTTNIPRNNLLLLLSDFSNSEVGSRYKFESITSEEGNEFEAYDGSGDYPLYAFIDSSGSYIDFSINGYPFFQTVSFLDDDLLTPSEWIIVRAKVKVSSGHEDETMTILAKQTESAGDPLYSLGTSDGEYHFSLSLGEESTKVKLTGGTVSTDWVSLVGIYTGDWVYFYVDERNVADAGYSADIYSENDAKRLALGYSTVSDDYPFVGYLDDVYIWGGDSENTVVSSSSAVGDLELKGVYTWSENTESVACNDGEDNDADALGDYYGICDVATPGVTIDCSTYSSAQECQSACEAEGTTVYTPADTGCSSFDDNDEISCVDADCGAYICDASVNDCYSSCTSKGSECASGYACTKGVCKKSLLSSTKSKPKGAAEYDSSSYLPWIIGAVGVLLIGGILYWHFKPSSPVKKGKRK